MTVVNVGRDTGVREEVGGGVLIPALALVEDNNHLYSTFLGIDKCFGNGFTGEGVRLNKDLGPRGVQFSDQCFSGTTVWREEDSDGSGGTELLGAGSEYCREEDQSVVLRIVIFKEGVHSTRMECLSLVIYCASVKPL